VYFCNNSVGYELLYVTIGIDTLVIIATTPVLPFQPHLFLCAPTVPSSMLADDSCPTVTTTVRQSREDIVCVFRSRHVRVWFPSETKLAALDADGEARGRWAARARSSPSQRTCNAVYNNAVLNAVDCVAHIRHHGLFVWFLLCNILWPAAYHVRECLILCDN